jgi:putative endopeptidase
VTVKKPQVLLLSLAVAFALSACNGDKANSAAGDAAAPADTDAAGAKALTLDESKLPAVNRFE